MQTQQRQEIEFTQFDEDEEYPLSLTASALEALKDAIANEELKPYYDRLILE